MTPAQLESGLPVEAPDKEALVKRNPYDNFAAVEAERKPYNLDDEWKLTKAPNPDWNFGDGANNDKWKNHKFLSIDPYEDGRDLVLNYKLMISATIPRPIALASSVTEDGKTRNIAPFSYFQCVTTDANDTVKNILATKECCISLTSDWIIEAANFTSVNTPPHISEWELAGLTPIPGDVVKVPYVGESPYSVECKYYSHQDFYSRVDPGVKTATQIIVEIVRFHIWEDALGPDRATADARKLRPVARLGGITYGNLFEGFEIPRPDAFRALRQDERVDKILKEQENQAQPKI
ncbi:uncharacterized protein JN550_007581 [Neoarthrinium moseri]|uniref:uncharacterized protein n=1 Tax=Neoarthrinium moseri TaxID=1658444 RepID=UPI001FDB45FA|nr:uncharacterized protein JN550_007581 [Neoarthrinium moseri]KAI1866728.1 hypothetical protein JN550_007581 [Neoarthrinium moseri]